MNVAYASFPFVMKDGKPHAYYSWYDVSLLGLKKKHIEVFYDLTNPCIGHYYANGNYVLKIQD